MAESHAIGISVASYTHGGERDRDRERQRDREKEEKSVKPISLHCNMKRVIGHQQQKNTILCPFFLVCSSEVYCDQTNRYILKVHSISISSVYLLTHLFKKSSLSLTLSLYPSFSRQYAWALWNSNQISSVYRFVLFRWHLMPHVLVCTLLVQFSWSTGFAHSRSAGHIFCSHEIAFT